MSEIYIAQPCVEEYTNGLYRLCANITCEEQEDKLFVEVEAKYKEYLTWERSDAFLFLCIPIAVREGYNIRCEAPVSEMFLHNLNTILIPAITQGDSRAKKIDIIAETASELPSAGAVGTGVSCGVDSTYTIMEYTNEKYDSMKLTHLLVGSVSSDLWGVYGDDNLLTWQEKYASTFARYEEVSEYTGLPIVKVFTNFVPFLIRRRETNVWYKHVNVHIYITMGMILTLKKLFSIYYFASAYDYVHFSLKDNLSNSSADYELLLMYAVSSPSFTCFAAGGSVDRIEKTAALADYPLAQKVLHPCFRPEKKNCSSPLCNKCLRGLFALDYHDKLDLMTEVYDVERYRNNKQKYLLSLIKDKNTGNLSKLYQLFLEKYPEEMRLAQEVYDKRTEPVSKEDYDSLLKTYESILLLLSKESPKDAIVSFFTSKEIKKLYYAGVSKFGQKIIELLEGTVEIITYKTGNVNDCDAVFVGYLSDANIEKIKKKLAKKIEKTLQIYTVKDMRFDVDLEQKQKTSAEYDTTDAKEISRGKYDALIREYETALFLLSEVSPQKTMVAFFQDKGIQKLFYAGDSKLGQKLMELLEGYVEVVTEKTGNVNDCDAIYVAGVTDHDIKTTKIYLASKKTKPMDTYTFKAIKTFLKSDER